MSNKQKEIQEWLALCLTNQDQLLQIVIKFGGGSYAEWEDAVKHQNIYALGNMLQKTWESAPDKPWIHEIPGWRLLCDLCSDFMFGGINP